MSESKLRSVFLGFKPIIAELEDKEISPEFWKKESENIIKIVRKYKRWKEAIQPTPESLNKVFGRLKGE